jgi:hypothetical protein
MNIQKTETQKNLDNHSAKNMSINNTYAIKTLNSSAKLLLLFVYTLLTTATAYYLSKDQKKNEIALQLDVVKRNQLEMTTKVNTSLKKISDDLQYRHSLMNLEAKVITAITKKLAIVANNDKKTIENQKQVIYDLKQKIGSLITFSKDFNNEDEQAKTLSYSSENSDILYYKHQQILKRLKLKNKSKEEAFISLFDMGEISNQEKLTDLKERLDLEYYSKKRELSGLREKFRTQKFLNIVAKK